MKTYILILAATGVLFSACSSGSDSAPDPKSAIAGDKAQVVEILKLSDSKGTAAEAFMDAAQDSSLNAKMRAALGLTAESPKAAASKTYATKSRTAPKDGLDKANDALDNANAKLEKTEKVVDKTGQVLDKAGEIKRKTGDIFK